MISLSDSRLYEASLAELKRHRPTKFYGRLVQMILACKHYGATVPQIGADTGIGIGVLQRIFDDLYAKRSREPGKAILSLFNADHLLRTSREGSNIWRNNINFQKGFACYASANELNDNEFRTNSRVDCPYLKPKIQGDLRGATCSIVSSAKYRKEDHPKVFQLDPANRDIFVYNLSDIQYFRSIYAPGGKRIPAIPLICAIYHDSLLSSGRTEVDVLDFLLDFNFTPEEFSAYFDDDPTLSAHSNLVGAFPGLTWTRAPNPRRILKKPKEQKAAPKGPVPPEELPDTAHAVQPPAGSHWWDAEQAVKTALRQLQWTVIDRSRQGAGFDLEAKKGANTIFVEVKSSSGACSPNLTENEYRQATRLGGRYFLAVIENFDPSREARILWIADPASLQPMRRTVEIYPLPRAVWLRHAKTDLGR